MRFKGKKILFNRNDTYSLYSILEPVICAGLKKFKEVITTDSVAKEWAGVPSPVLYSLFPEGGAIDKYNFSEDQIEQGSKEWLGIIDKMIYAFENKEPCCIDYDFEFVPQEDHMKKTEDGNYEWHMEPDNQEEYDKLRKDEKLHEEKVKEGRLLLSTYFENLWW